MEIDNESFLHVNYCKANMKAEQIKTLEKLLSHIKLLNIDNYYQITCACNFNFLLNSQLEAMDEILILKANLFVNFLKQENVRSCHIWRVRKRD